MVFVRERGKAMAAAAAVTPTGMTAVLGGDRDEVVATAQAHGLTAANENGAGQIVVAGTLEQLAAFAADPPEKARLRTLQVAGAFHTTHMAPAVGILGQLARSIYMHSARLPIISNADGTVVHSGREVVTRLVTQVSSPVRWDLCMATMAQMGVTAVLELPPAGTLTGLAKRALPGVEALALNTPDDLPAAWDLIERHATETSMSQAPTWRLLVAPAKGIWKLGVSSEVGDALVPGAPVGSVVNLRDEQPVLALHGGTVVEWLVEDGDPVSPGQPIVRLHPEAASA
jgi:[acyl-carrier-protein] S-malonyltransferase